MSKQYLRVHFVKGEFVNGKSAKTNAEFVKYIDFDAAYLATPAPYGAAYNLIVYVEGIEVPAHADEVTVTISDLSAWSVLSPSFERLAEIHAQQKANEKEAHNLFLEIQDF